MKLHESVMFLRTGAAPLKMPSARLNNLFSETLIAVSIGKRKKSSRDRYRILLKEAIAERSIYKNWVKIVKILLNFA